MRLFSLLRMISFGDCSQHKHLMRQLEQFEIQQEGRWVAYTEADKMQQASLRNTISDVQRLGMMVDQSRLDSIRSELALLQEAVGTLQASSAACDAKLDLVLQSRQQGEGQPRLGDLTRPPQRDAGEQEPPRAYLEALSGHRRQIEVVVKQLQEEKRLRSILEDKLEAETAARQALAHRLSILEQRDAHPVASRPRIFEMSPGQGHVTTQSKPGSNAGGSYLRRV